MAEKKKPTKKAAPKKAAPKKPAAPKKVEAYPDYPEARVGEFCQVVAGEHDGRYGVFLERVGDSDSVIVRTRDDANERIVVALKHLRPAEAGKR